MRELRQSTGVTIIVGPFVDQSAVTTPETGVVLGNMDDAGAVKHEAGASTSIGGRAWNHVFGGNYGIGLKATDTDTSGQLRVGFVDPDIFQMVWQDFNVLPTHQYDAKYGNDWLNVNIKEWSGSSVYSGGVTVLAGVTNPPVNVSRIFSGVSQPGAVTLTVTSISGISNPPVNVLRLFSGVTNPDKTGYSISGTSTTFDDMNDINTSDVSTQVVTALKDLDLDRLMKRALTNSHPSDINVTSALGFIMNSGTSWIFARGDSLGSLGTGVTVSTGVSHPAVAVASGISNPAVNVLRLFSGVTNPDKTGYSLSSNQSSVTIGMIQRLGGATIAVTSGISNPPVTLARIFSGVTQPGNVTLTITAGVSNPPVRFASDQSAVTIGLVQRLGSGATMGTAMQSNVSSQIVQVLRTDTYTEPGQEAPPVAATLFKKIGHIYKYLRNKTTSTSTQLWVWDDAGTVVDQKSTISDSGTTFTKGEFVSGP